MKLFRPHIPTYFSLYDQKRHYSADTIWRGIHGLLLQYHIWLDDGTLLVTQAEWPEEHCSEHSECLIGARSLSACVNGGQHPCNFLKSRAR